MDRPVGILYLILSPLESEERHFPNESESSGHV